MILAAWLLKRLAAKVLFVNLGLAMLLTVFDSMAQGGEFTAGAQGYLLPMVCYALLRFPAIVLFLLPFSVLIAALITYGSLSARREIVALEFTGFTVARISVIFVVAVAGLAGLAAWVGDRVLPRAYASLQEWEALGYRGLPDFYLTPQHPEWMASGSYIVHTSKISDDGTRLESPTLLRLSDDGLVTLYLRAERAVYESGRWQLQQVIEKNINTGRLRTPTARAVELDLKPSQLALMNQDVEALRFKQLRWLGWSQVETPKESPQFYRMAAYRRIAQPLAAVILLLFAAPAAAQLDRVDRRAIVSILALAAGFLYFVVERFCLAMGEVGDLPAPLAAFGPHLLFGVLAIGILRRTQK